MLKWLAGILLTLVILLVLAIVIIPIVFDPNNYQQDIIDLVKKETGRDLELNGKLSMSVFPWLGIQTEGLSLSQPEQVGDSGGPMLSVDGAQLRIKLIPLLSKRAEIDTVVLEKPRVQIVSLANGDSSFTGLMSEDSEQVDTESSDIDPASSVALLIQGFRLTDGSFEYVDKAANVTTQLKDVNINTGNLIGTDPVDIEVSGVLVESTQEAPMTFDLQGKGLIDLDSLQMQFTDMRANVEQADLNANLQVEAIKFAAESEQLEGEKLLVQAVMAERTFDFVVDSFNADLMSQLASFQGSRLSSGDMNQSLAGLQVKQLVDNPTATAKIVLDKFNAATLLRELGVEFEPSDKKALSEVALKTNLIANAQRLSLSNLLFEMDQSRLQGKFSVKDFTAKPSIDFDLVLDSLNVDNYLPATDETQDSPETSSVSGAEALAVPMALFKEFAANGSFKADKLISGGVQLDNIDVQVNSDKGVLSIVPRASLYKGNLDGSMVYSDTEKGSELKVKNSIDLVSLAELLTDADVTEQLSGIGSLLVDVVVTELNGVQSNQGTIKLVARNGALKGIDIKGLIDQGYAQYKSYKDGDKSASEQASEGESKSSDETKFAELLGTFRLNDYKITNDDFSMKAPLFRVAGEGEIDLAAQNLNYLVNVSIVNTTEGQGGEAIDALRGITIPIRFRGALDSPRYSLDMKTLYKNLVKSELDKKKSELIAEKLGVEDSEKLSSKDVLKQVLLNKLNKNKQATDGSATSDAKGKESSDEAEKSAKDKLKDDLKNKLLDSIFK